MDSSENAMRNLPVFPHIFVWGSCFWFCIPLPSARSRPPAPVRPAHQTIFVTHHLSHTTLSHTIFHHTILHPHLCHTPIFHTQLCHTPSFTTPSYTHIFVTHQSFTQLCHTQLSHTPSFTHNFVTHHLTPTSLSHTPIFHTTLSHTTLSHTIFHHTILRPHLCHTPIFHTQLCHTPSLALGDIHLRFTWHLGWAGSGGALGPGLVAGDAAALCAAGVALGDIHLRFTWQAWHLETFTCILRGRRGT